MEDPIRDYINGVNQRISNVVMWGMILVIICLLGMTSCKHHTPFEDINNCENIEIKTPIVGKEITPTAYGVYTRYEGRLRRHYVTKEEYGGYKYNDSICVRICKEKS